MTWRTSCTPSVKWPSSWASAPTRCVTTKNEGLITPASKTAAGYRLYNDNALQRIRFIKHAQQCGFTLSNINDLLKLKRENSACCNDVRSVAIEKKLYLEHKIKALQLMSQALGELITICDDETRPLVGMPDSRSTGKQPGSPFKRSEAMIKVEVFSSPGCGKCTQAKNMLKTMVDEMGQGQITWREVNILEEMDYAVELGVMSSPSIAINGELAFSSLPSAKKLQSELNKWLA